MVMVRGIRAEWMKLGHTAVLWLHVWIPVLGAVIFLSYFTLYRNTELTNKMALVLELTAVVFPIIVGVVCGMMGVLEEKAGHFQAVMMSPDGRVIPYLNKLLGAVLLGGGSTVLLAGLTVAGSNTVAPLPGGVFWGAAFGMFIGIIPLYIIHMFLSIQWGLGASVFVGVAESLLAVMFSNVDTVTWSFIPCAWSVQFLRNALFAAPISAAEIGVIVIISGILLLLSIVWFRQWEGRKSFE